MFVARVASLFALLVAAHAQGQCGTDTIGKTEGSNVIPRPQTDVPLPPGIKAVNLDIPYSMQLCALVGHHVGTKVSACDDDVAPSVKLTQLQHATIHRGGSASGPGLVHTSIYCETTLPPARSYGGVPRIYSS